MLSPSTRSPISKYPFYMLIETSGSRMDHDEEKLHKFLQNVMENRLVLDGTVTNDPGKMKVRKMLNVQFTAVSSDIAFKCPLLIFQLSLQFL